MRKVFRVFLITAVIAVSAVYSVSASNTATLNIQVTVPKTVAISVESTSYAENLDFSDDPRDVHLGTVREMSNSFDGYKVFLTSENASSDQSTHAFFASSDGSSSAKIPYVLSYGGEVVNFDGGTAKVTDLTGTLAVGRGNEREVRLVNLDRSAMPDPGAYSDTLTFTIAAN